MDFFNRYISNPWHSGVLMKLIFINTAVFVCIHLVSIITPIDKIIEVLAVPASVQELPRLWWTPVTYCWIHINLWHLATNMLWLYLLGRIFLLCHSQRALMILYICGGICGAISYCAIGDSLGSPAHGGLIGASACVTAVIATTAILMPGYECNIPLIGNIRLVWIAIFAVILSSADYIAEASGSALAHLGGAIPGVAYAIFEIVRQHLVRRNVDSAFRKSQARAHKQEAYSMDAIIDKVKKSGYSALTDKEKELLFNVSKKN